MFAPPPPGGIRPLYIPSDQLIPPTPRYPDSSFRQSADSPTPPPPTTRSDPRGKCRRVCEGGRGATPAPPPSSSTYSKPPPQPFHNSELGRGGKRTVELFPCFTLSSPSALGKIYLNPSHNKFASYPLSPHSCYSQRCTRENVIVAL